MFSLKLNGKKVTGAHSVRQLSVAVKRSKHGQGMLSFLSQLLTNSKMDTEQRKDSKKLSEVAELKTNCNVSAMKGKNDCVCINCPAKLATEAAAAALPRPSMIRMNKDAEECASGPKNLELVTSGQKQKASGMVKNDEDNSWRFGVYDAILPCSTINDDNEPKRYNLFLSDLTPPISANLPINLTDWQFEWTTQMNEERNKLELQAKANIIFEENGEESSCATIHSISTHVKDCKDENKNENENKNKKEVINETMNENENENENDMNEGLCLFVSLLFWFFVWCGFI